MRRREEHAQVVITNAVPELWVSVRVKRNTEGLLKLFYFIATKLINELSVYRVLDCVCIS